jgi:hypothetical protein
MSYITKYLQTIWPRDKKDLKPELQERISKLYAIKQKLKSFSPTLQVINKDKNKVMRLKSLYENNLKEFSEETPLVASKSFGSRLNLAGFEESLEQTLDSFKDRRFSTPESVKNVETDYFNIIMKLMIESDKTFIDHMENLIEIFVKNFKNLPLFRLKNEAEVMENQKRELFGPIEEIYDFHVLQFHPMLLTYADNMEGFSEFLSMMCNKNWFNCFVEYALDEEVS